MAVEIFNRDISDAGTPDFYYYYYFFFFFTAEYMTLDKVIFVWIFIIIFYFIFFTAEYMTLDKVIFVHFVNATNKWTTKF